MTDKASALWTCPRSFSFCYTTLPYFPIQMYFLQIYSSSFHFCQVRYNSYMKKYLQLVVVLGFFGFLVLLRQAKGNDEQPVVAPPQNINNSEQNQITPITGTPSSSGSSSAPSSSTPTTNNSGQYKNGTYTGSVTDAFYGNYQVQAVISGGKLTDVIFLQYPNDNPTSRSINTQAAVFLKQEAIAAQSATVDIVSGASDSSQAFRQSLGSALSQAH